MEVDAALERDGAGEPEPCRHLEGAASEGGEGIYAPGESRGIEGKSV